MTGYEITECPYCFRHNDAHAPVGTEGGPKEGDMSLCLYCGGIALFAACGSVNLPTPLELAEIEADPRVQVALAGIRGITS